MSRLALPLLAAPVVLLAIFFSLGLFLASLRSSDKRQPGENALLEPVAGAAAALILTTVLARAGLSGRLWVGVTLLVCIAAAGAALRRIGHDAILARARILSVPLGLFLICYLALVSPLLARGTVGVTGYNVNNDSVVHVILADQLAGPGLRAPTVISSFTQTAAKNVNEGYPIGFHLMLAIVVVLTGLPAFYLFNAVVAVMVALGVFVFYFYGTHLGMRRGLAVLAALGATLAYLTVGFAIQGFAPQVSLTPFLYTAMLGIYAYFRRPADGGTLLFVTLVIIACLVVYSFTALLWLAPFGVLVLLLSWKSSGLTGLARKSAVLFGCLMIVGALSVLPVLLKYFAPLRGEVQNFQITGNLLGKISVATASGAWLSTDHRFGPLGERRALLSFFVAALVGLLAAGGALRAARARRHFLWATVLVAVGAVALLNFASGPYYFSKAIQLSSPAIILAALYGADGVYAELNSRLGGLPGGAAKALATVFLAGIVVVAASSDGLEARAISLTPSKRFEELRRIDSRFAGQGPALFLEKDDWGKYFLRQARGSSLVDGAYIGMGAGVALPGAKGDTLDFDSLAYHQLSRFDLLVAGHDNLASLPSPAYQGSWAGNYYVVYKKNARLFSRVLEHKSAEGLDGNQTRGGLVLGPRGSRIVRFEHPLDGAYLAIGGRALSGAAVDVKAMRMGQGWAIWSADSNTAVNVGLPGASMTSVMRVNRTGTYDIYILGQLTIGLDLRIGSTHLIGHPRPSEGFDYVSIGSARLAAGRPYPLRISSPRPTPQSINYVQKVVLVAREHRDTAELSFSGSRSGASVRVGMTPQVVQVAGVEAMAGRNRYAVALVNTSDLPVKIDWLELLSRPYPAATLDSFERFHRHNKEVILASF